VKEALLKEYRVWDVPTRIFHWVNFVTVLLLIFMGLIMLFKESIGISSVDAKIGLKAIHVMIGYVFVINLAIRLVWGFIGNPYSRWSNILPGKGFGEKLAGFKASLDKGEPQQFLGHNPIGRIAITLIMFSLIIMAVTGLIRAGTDIYYPPFGSHYQAQVAAEGVDPATIKPYDKTGVDADKAKALGEFKEPIGTLHLYISYFLMLLIFVHITAVVVAEIKEGEGLVSAMIHGRKLLSKEPEDFLG